VQRAAASIAEPRFMAVYLIHLISAAVNGPTNT
jgi:hypothetical protein